MQPIKSAPKLRLVDCAPVEMDDMSTEKIRGWPLLLIWMALGLAAWACAIAAGYVLVMLFRLVTGAAA